MSSDVGEREFRALDRERRAGSPRLRQICGFIYGDDWLYDRERSKYLVLADETTILAPAEQAAQPWRDSKKIYATTDDTFAAVTPAAF